MKLTKDNITYEITDTEQIKVFLKAGYVEVKEEKKVIKEKTKAVA